MAVTEVASLGRVAAAISDAAAKQVVNRSR